MRSLKCLLGTHENWLLDLVCLLLRNTEEVSTASSLYRQANPCYAKFPFISSLKKNKGKEVAYQSWTKKSYAASHAIIYDFE